MSPEYRLSRRFTIRPVTPERWAELEQLFGPRGATGGCWCMWFRLKRAEFEKRKGEANRRAFKGIVERGEVPGLLAYESGEPVGWCAVAPRENYTLLENSRILKRVDEQPVWSVVCFFIAKSHRQKGLTTALLKAAVAFAAKRGARIVEGYPVDPGESRIPAAFAYHGLAAAFRAAGFKEVARRSPTRPIMRYFVGSR
jgi:GNAT superfamily N-acetyltransferase